MAPNCDYKSRAIGAALSHVALWRKAAEENRIVTVFEDDAVATYRFQEKTARILSTFAGRVGFQPVGIYFRSDLRLGGLRILEGDFRFYDQRFKGTNKLEFQCAEFSHSAFTRIHTAYRPIPSRRRRFVSC
jgi:GR25 family glycosyltransferase involved in LPS biosynthesis